MGIVDLSERETDNFYYTSWKDEDLVHLQIGYITISIPESEVSELCEFLKETRNQILLKR